MFSHASASRNVTSTAWVIAKSEQHTGYGESCPRSYVTGETMASIISFFDNHRSDIQQNIIDLASLKSWVGGHSQEINDNPAAWCAIELALLDLFAKGENQSVEQLLGIPQLGGEFQYTAVLGDNQIEQFARQVDQYSAMAFVDYKVKISGDNEKDKEKLRYLAESVSGARIRLDANNLWHAASQANDYLNLLEAKLFAVEEPLQANDYEGLREVASTVNAKIILDESFLREEQFAFIKNDPSIWIINLRVSKMGGLLRSLAIAATARQLGIGLIIGAQVGETSLLTRAALSVANANRDILIAQEGAYGTILLEKDICQVPLMFGKGGKIHQEQLDALGPHGFGLAIEQDGLF
ncbi:mandelate racemase/muconate lactonizing enzyme family protein [Kaarinaea lacus]